jgi:hypothetical protein
MFSMSKEVGVAWTCTGEPQSRWVGCLSICLSVAAYACLMGDDDDDEDEDDAPLNRAVE